MPCSDFFRRVPYMAKACGLNGQKEILPHNTSSSFRTMYSAHRHEGFSVGRLACKNHALGQAVTYPGCFRRVLWWRGSVVLGDLKKILPCNPSPKATCYSEQYI